jgi:hypothetical protein
MDPINEAYNQSITEAKTSIELDTVLGDDKKFDQNFFKFLKSRKIKMTIVDPSGPGGGWPIIKYVGDKKAIEDMVKKFFAQDDEAFDFLMTYAK